MGRAIDMEKDIDIIKSRVKKLENIARGMSDTIEDLEETIDVLIDKEKAKEKKTDGKEKSNNETDDGSSGKSNKRKTNTVSKTNKS